MSLTLCFTPKDNVGLINLPVTFPTDISIKILSAETTKERLNIIKAYLLDSKQENPDKTIKLLETYFSNPALTLSLI